MLIYFLTSSALAQAKAKVPPPEPAPKVKLRAVEQQIDQQTREVDELNDSLDVLIEAVRSKLPTASVVQVEGSFVVCPPGPDRPCTLVEVFPDPETDAVPPFPKDWEMDTGFTLLDLEEAEIRAVPPAPPPPRAKAKAKAGADG